MAVSKKKTTATKKITRKSPTRKKRSKKLKKYENAETLRLFVTNEEVFGGIERVDLDRKYRHQYVEKFGLTGITSKNLFNEWFDSLINPKSEDEV